MSWLAILKLSHAFVGFWVVAGVVGRGLVQLRAERSSDINAVRLLLDVIGRFDRLMVIPGSAAVLLLGLLTAWVEGLPILGSLQGGHVNWLFAAVVLYAGWQGLVPTVFIPRGKAFQAALDEAVGMGRITERLTRAFHDPVVRAAHVWELVAIALIIWLMITKPF